jgi:hypothetical protein
MVVSFSFGSTMDDLTEFTRAGAPLDNARVTVKAGELHHLAPVGIEGGRYRL